MNKISLLSVFVILLLTSCSVFSPVKIEPQTTYVLNTLPQPTIKKSARHITLLVMPPETNSVYKTTRIAYTTRPYQVGYFAKNAWAEQPADMIYPLIIQTLQNTRHFYAIATMSNPVNYDYVLNTQIMELLQDYTHVTGLVFLTVRAEITNAKTNRIIATKEFTIVEDFLQKNPYCGVAATNHATARMLQQLAEFCVRII